MRDLKFACPHCEQHVQCDDSMSGQFVPCPACGRKVQVPSLPDEHHLRFSTGRVPIPAHAHAAPRAGEPEIVVVARPPAPKYSQLAVASLALSCASVVLWPFGFVPGIVLGYMARAEIQRNDRLLGDRMARAGIWIGFGFMGLFALAVCIGLALRIAGRY
jgi:hypothetical protein